MNQVRFCFDLDGTLVSSPKMKGDYSTVSPIEKNIRICQHLKSLGHYIIIYTARKMRTNNGNIGKCIADIGEITINTLKNFNIPYDELIFGKPCADFYIDDLAINANEDLAEKLEFYLMSVQKKQLT